MKPSPASPWLREWELQAGRLRFVVPVRLGEAVAVNDVPPADRDAALSDIGL